MNDLDKQVIIGNKIISEESPAFIIAEISANHMMDINRAKEIIKAAAKAKADAVKLQTYTPDTITMNSEKSYFQITQGTIWDGTTLHKLYQNAYTPWEWQEELMNYANSLGMLCFSSPFDMTAVDFMKELDMPAYKVASFEINDIPMIEKIAKINKPIIISTGIAYEEDIYDALFACKKNDNNQVILLKCTSSYPAPYEDINLETIKDMKEKFSCLVGLSDHTLGTAVSVAAVAKGAKIIEKHLTLKREDGGPDAAFSMEPEEFEKMVKEIRIVEKASGITTYDLTQKQKNSREHKRSLFVNKDIKKGEIFTHENIRSVRPAFGIEPRYYNSIIGKVSKKDLEYSEPLSFDDIDMNTSIGILVNIGTDIGIGHLKRCIPIAKNLINIGVKICFILQDMDRVNEDSLDTFFLDKEFDFLFLKSKSEIDEILENKKFDLVLIDRYDISDDDIKNYKKSIRKIAVMDDIDFEKGRSYSNVECIINPALEYQQNNNIELLFGNRYCIIDDKFINRKKQHNIEKVSYVDEVEKLKNVLVLTGGSNNHNMAYHITKELIELKYEYKTEFKINVIIGPKSLKVYESDLVKLEKYDFVELIYSPENIEDYMIETDAAITAGGNTIYELNYLEVKTFTYSVSENQIPLNKKLDALGVVEYLGDFKDMNLKKVLETLSVTDSLKQEEKIKRIIDGNGARRIADKLLEITSN